MKYILATLALAGVVISASAQVPTDAPQTLVGPISITNQTAYTNQLVLDVRKQASVCIQADMQCNGSDTTALVFPLQRSVDGVRYDVGDMISIAPNGTTMTTVFTNIPTYGCGYMKVFWVTNSHLTVNVTNFTLKYGVKISSP